MASESRPVSISRAARAAGMGGSAAIVTAIAAYAFLIGLTGEYGKASQSTLFFLGFAMVSSLLTTLGCILIVFRPLMGGITRICLMVSFSGALMLGLGLVSAFSGLFTAPRVFILTGGGGLFCGFLLLGGALIADGKDCQAGVDPKLCPLAVQAGLVFLLMPVLVLIFPCSFFSPMLLLGLGGLLLQASVDWRRPVNSQLPN